jgi:hypothetical protein
MILKKKKYLRYYDRAYLHCARDMRCWYKIVRQSSRQYAVIRTNVLDHLEGSPNDRFSLEDIELNDSEDPEKNNIVFIFRATNALQTHWVLLRGTGSEMTFSQNAIASVCSHYRPELQYKLLAMQAKLLADAGGEGNGGRVDGGVNVLPPPDSPDGKIDAIRQRQSQAETAGVTRASSAEGFQRASTAASAWSTAESGEGPGNGVASSNTQASSSSSSSAAPSGSAAANSTGADPSRPSRTHKAGQFNTTDAGRIPPLGPVAGRRTGTPETGTAGVNTPITPGTLNFGVEDGPQPSMIPDNASVRSGVSAFSLRPTLAGSAAGSPPGGPANGNPVATNTAVTQVQSLSHDSDSFGTAHGGSPPAPLPGSGQPLPPGSITHHTDVIPPLSTDSAWSPPGSAVDRASSVAGSPLVEGASGPSASRRLLRRQSSVFGEPSEDSIRASVDQGSSVLTQVGRETAESNRVESRPSGALREGIELARRISGDVGRRMSQGEVIPDIPVPPITRASGASAATSRISGASMASATSRGSKVSPGRGSSGGVEALTRNSTSTPAHTRLSTSVAASTITTTISPLLFVSGFDLELMGKSYPMDSSMVFSLISCLREIIIKNNILSFTIDYDRDMEARQNQEREKKNILEEKVDRWLVPKRNFLIQHRFETQERDMVHRDCEMEEDGVTPIPRPLTENEADVLRAHCTEEVMRADPLMVS